MYVFILLVMLIQVVAEQKINMNIMDQRMSHRNKN